MKGRQPSAGDKVLADERKDPVAFLKRRATRLRDELRLRPEWIEEGIPLVVDALGEDWLRAECARRQPLMYRLNQGHEIATAFLTGSGASVVLVLELVLYLKHLAGCLGFPDTLPQLRSDFGSTLLQLAQAYRIHTRGPRVRLEPPARDGRRDDIAFRWSGRPYQVDAIGASCALIRSTSSSPSASAAFWEMTPAAQGC